jgi:hypothetical protein
VKSDKKNIKLKNVLWNIYCKCAKLGGGGWALEVKPVYICPEHNIWSNSCRAECCSDFDQNAESVTALISLQHSFIWQGLW